MTASEKGEKRRILFLRLAETEHKMRLKEAEIKDLSKKLSTAREVQDTLTVRRYNLLSKLEAYDE